MSEVELREAFAEFRGLGSAALPLDAAILVARCERDVAPDAQTMREALAILAEGAREYANPDAGVRACVEGLCVFLKDVKGLGGSTEEYYLPENSYLDVVLETGRGIPITLAVIYLDVARRLGLDCEGVNFPGHFLVRVQSDSAAETDAEDQAAVHEPLLVDPFAGQVVSWVECNALLQRSQGPDTKLADKHLAAATGRQILLRMLNNLKQLALSQEHWDVALRWSERIQLVEPDLLMEHRDRALVYEHIDEPASAVAEWHSLAEALRDAELKDKVEARIAVLEGKVDAGRVLH